eukprot:3691328-Rhodomonas_salina.2
MEPVDPSSAPRCGFSSQIRSTQDRGVCSRLPSFHCCTIVSFTRFVVASAAQHADSLMADPSVIVDPSSAPRCGFSSQIRSAQDPAPASSYSAFKRRRVQTAEDYFHYVDESREDRGNPSKWEGWQETTLNGRAVWVLPPTTKLEELVPIIDWCGIAKKSKRYLCNFCCNTFTGGPRRVLGHYKELVSKEISVEQNLESASCAKGDASSANFRAKLDEAAKAYNEAKKPGSQNRDEVLLPRQRASAADATSPAQQQQNASSMCEHYKPRNTCVDCGGPSVWQRNLLFCEHDMRRGECP